MLENGSKIAGGGYQNDDGSYVKNDWLTLGEEKYHFDDNGYIQTGLIEITVDPIVEVNTGGIVKKFYMIDINTLTPCNHGVVPANNQVIDFAFVSEGYQ